MQWNSNQQTSAGFTLANVKSWLPLHPNYKQINVLKQLTKANSHLYIYKDLVRLRRLPQFQYGRFEYAIVDNFIFSFFRRILNDMLSLVILNMSNHTVTYDFYNLQNMTRNAIVAYSCCSSKGPYDIGNIIDTANVEIKPKSFLVLHRLI
jgi:alpha-glucosidase